MTAVRRRAFPNGMTISPDGTTLVVAESHSSRQPRLVAVAAADAAGTFRRTPAGTGVEQVPRRLRKAC